MKDNYDLGAFITVTNDAMDLKVAFQNNTGSHVLHHKPPVSQPLAPSILPKTIGVPSSSIAPVDATRTNHSSLFCNNCKKLGHLDLTCFKEGGGLAGQCDEYSSDHSHMHAMFSECLEGAFYTLDSIHNIPHPLDPPLSPTSFPPAIDDKLIVPLAAMCIQSSVMNPDLIQDLYILCDSEFPSLALSGSVDFKSSAFLSLTTLFNALLDSGCTHHIIKDRSLFLEYASRNISVGTGNCGSLQALGVGDVSFQSSYGDCHVLFTL